MKFYLILRFSVIVFILVFINQNYAFAIPSARSIANPPMKIVLIDTANREKYLYKPCIDILETLGWQVDYRPIDQLMDFGPKSLNLSHYKAAFFFINFEFLQGIGKSPVSEKILILMQRYCKLPNRLVGLIFPTFNVPPHVNVLAGVAPILNCLGINTPTTLPPFPTLDKSESAESTESASLYLQKTLDAFFYMTRVFLSTPLESRPLDYHTTLNPPHPGIAFYTKDINRLLQEAALHLKLLPLGQQYSDTVKQTFPYGLYWFNPLQNNHVFIAPMTIFSFASISESFHFCPMKAPLRKEIHKGIEQMLQELTTIIRGFDQEKKFFPDNELEALPDAPLPPFITEFGAPLEQELSPQTHKIAWMDLTVFEEKGLDATLSTSASAQSLVTQQEQQDRLIVELLDAGLDTLWITINPHAYYSPIARHTGKEQIFLNSLSLFTQKLTSFAQTKNKPLPHLFIGFEIANNLYEPNLPKQPSLDLYGTNYSDLPSSLDRSFWYNEVKKPLAIFMAKWKKTSISNGIPITGVVLDLEMYGRKTSGQFLTPMGFDQASFARFTKQHRLGLKHLPVNERVRLLMQLKRSSQYFSFLEQDAENLGTELKLFFSKHIPGCTVSCYMPSILISWFYKGFCKGLSSTKKPLQLFTFNTEFQGHKRWFELNNTTVQHASVLLLSKITAPKDFEYVDIILKQHHGIWLNRFSRMVEPKTADWATVERPTIDEKDYAAFCTHISKVQ